MVFIPFITQVPALVFGLVAVLRRRQPNERIAIAWVGIALASVALALWIVGLVFLVGATSGPTPLWVPTTARVTNTDTAEATQQLATAMERVFHAAKLYDRDFRHWPASVDAMAGLNLPSAYALPPGIHYRPVPPDQQASTTWILMVSDAVAYDREGRNLQTPHRLIIRLSGDLELLPAENVQAVLDAASTPARTQP
ncbi:MAG: DUF4190 domain-containing protein [Phycisphaerae bacterium]